MKRHLAAPLLAVICLVVSVHLAAAQDTAVHVGATVNDLLIAYVGVFGTVISGLVTYLVYRFTGVRLEQAHRDALQTFVTNAAGAFLAKIDSLKDVKIEVGNSEIANLANMAFGRIPDALAYFHLSPADLQQMIVEKLGILTATEPDVETPATP